MIDYLHSHTLEVQRVVREYAAKDDLLFLDMRGICTAEVKVGYEQRLFNALRFDNLLLFRLKRGLTFQINQNVLH